MWTIAAIIILTWAIICAVTAYVLCVTSGRISREEEANGYGAPEGADGHH